jgi:hypothetical protein
MQDINGFWNKNQFTVFAGGDAVAIPSLRTTEGCFGFPGNCNELITKNNYDEEILLDWTPFMWNVLYVLCL